MLYIGVDLGTSAVKLLLMDETGEIHNTVTREYPLEFPRPGWSQQNPEDWWDAVSRGIPELLAGFDAGQVAGVGAAGQMHGLVILDEGGPGDSPGHPLERRPDRQGGGLPQQCGRAGAAVGPHRQHRLRGLYRPQAPVAAGE